MMSGAYPNGTYYIYSFDGRLLAEYDVAGQWVRDYIYFGGRLVAEYRAATPQPQYYFYASDQINSTRIVTDSTGNVVYSAAHEPYGGIQQTWVTNFDPELKFSGKPRDSESELDYFGARYYDRAQYRFISVDPEYSWNGVAFDQRLRNLYSYCVNSPINYMDPNGAYPVYINVVREQILPNGYIQGSVSVNGQNIGFSLELPWRNNQENISCIPAGTYGAYIGQFTTQAGQSFATVRLYGFDTLPRTAIAFHQGSITHGCILIGTGFDFINSRVTNEGGSALQALLEAVNRRDMELDFGSNLVMDSFDSLLSSADFPEIIVNISYSQALIARIISPVVTVVTSFLSVL